MPIFRITVADSDFSHWADVDVRDVAAARTAALKSALEIGSAELQQGKTFFAAEVRVDRELETCERLIVAIGTSTLR